MKLHFTINKKIAPAEFISHENTTKLQLGSHSVEAQYSEPESGLFTILIAGKVFNCVIEKNEISVNGKRIAVNIQDPKRLSHNAGAMGQTGGRIELTSPMPGKVVRVILNEGDDVGEEQSILVVEAMKMQNEIQSPKIGKISSIKVTEGQTVNAGEVLAVVE